MAWKLRSKNETLILLWNQIRTSRRDELKAAFDVIDKAGCSKTPGATPHPRSANLHLFQAGRYVIVFCCKPGFVEIHAITAVRGGSATNGIAQYG